MKTMIKQEEAAAQSIDTYALEYLLFLDTKYLRLIFVYV